MAGGSPIPVPKRGSALVHEPPAKRHRHNYHYNPPVPQVQQEGEEEEEELEEGEYTETPVGGSPIQNPLEPVVTVTEASRNAPGGNSYEVGEIVPSGNIGNIERSEDTSQNSAGLEAGEVLEGGKSGLKEVEGNFMGSSQGGKGGVGGAEGSGVEWGNEVTDGVKGQDKKNGVEGDQGIGGDMFKADLGGEEGTGNENWSPQGGGQCQLPYLMGEEDLEYDSGETNKGGNSQMEHQYVSNKGDDSDPFSDIDDSLIDVNEEMDACKRDDGIRGTKALAGVSKIKPGMSSNRVDFKGPISPQGRSDGEGPEAPLPNQADEGLNNMTSLLVGDRKQEGGGAMNQKHCPESVVHCGIHNDVGGEMQQSLCSGEQEVSRQPSGTQQEDMQVEAGGIGTISHEGPMIAPTGGLIYPEDESDNDDGGPLSEGLLPHYGSGDASGAAPMLVSYTSVDTNPRIPVEKKSSGQALSLLAEYGDDDDLEVDDDPVEPPLEEDNTKTGNAVDLVDEEPVISDMAVSEMQETPCVAGPAKRQAVDLPPHLKSLAMPSSPVASMEEHPSSIKNLPQSHNSNGAPFEANEPGNKPSSIEEMEAMLPEEYSDCAVGDVDPNVQETIRNLLEIQRVQKIFFNEEIMAHKKFRNPCFLTKMSAHFGIDEFGTELAANIYNPHGLAKEEYGDCLRGDRNRRASTSQVSTTVANSGMRATGPPSAPPGVQNAILQGQRRLREKFTSMAAGKLRPSKWDTGQ